MTDAEHIEELLHKYYAEQDKLRGYVFAAVREYHATEEILQAVAIVVAQKAATFDLARPTTPWFMGIARNKILQWFRTKGRDANTISFDVLDDCIPHMHPFALPEISYRQHALNHCLNRLPAKQKKIIELRYIDQCDCPDIATQLGRSIQSIYSLLKRLKAELRKCVELRLQPKKLT